jgi:hypothetical protein
MLFANLLGSVVVIWSIWRLRQPSRSIGLYDAVARMLFAIWQLFAVAQGASLLILSFTCFEVAFAIAQILPVTNSHRLKRTQALSILVSECHRLNVYFGSKAVCPRSIYLRKGRSYRR